jgi:hypothetical protein
MRLPAARTAARACASCRAELLRSGRWGVASGGARSTKLRRATGAVWRQAAAAASGAAAARSRAPPASRARMHAPSTRAPDGQAAPRRMCAAQRTDSSRQGVRAKQQQRRCTELRNSARTRQRRGAPLRVRRCSATAVRFGASRGSVRRAAPLRQCAIRKREEKVACVTDQTRGAAAWRACRSAANSVAPRGRGHPLRRAAREGRASSRWDRAAAAAAVKRASALNV